MIGKAFLCTALAAALVSGAGCGAAFALPTTWVLENGTFDDGGNASGEFTIDIYDYLTTPISITTTAGSLLGGYYYTPIDPSNIVPSTPPAYGVDFFSPNYDLELQLVFEYPLSSTGTDPLVLSDSFECAAYSCPGPDTGAPGADTRYFTSGDIVAAPEPASLSMLVAGIGALFFMLRRRRRILNAKSA
jgi:hypothetical protein